MQALCNCSELLQGLTKRLKSRQFVCLWGFFFFPPSASLHSRAAVRRGPRDTPDYCSCSRIHLFIIPLEAKWRLGLWINLGGFNVCFLNPLAPLLPHTHTRARTHMHTHARSHVHAHTLFRRPPEERCESSPYVYALGEWSRVLHANRVERGLDCKYQMENLGCQNTDVGVIDRGV